MVLVACEFSGVVLETFRARGHEARGKYHGEYASYR